MSVGAAVGVGPIIPSNTHPSSQLRWPLRRITRQGRLLLLSVLLASVILILMMGSGTTSFRGVASGSSMWSVGGVAGSNMAGLGRAQRQAIEKLRVAVIEPTAFHAEVITSVLTVLEDLNVNVTGYASSEANRVAVSTLRPGRRELLPTPDLGPAIDAGDFDVVVLDTCDAKFWKTQELQDLWDRIRNWATMPASGHGDPATAPPAGPAGYLERRVVCLPHEMRIFTDNIEDDMYRLYPVAQMGRLDIVSLAAHAKKHIQEGLSDWSVRSGSAFWEKTAILTEHFAPVFQLPPNLVPPKITRKGIRKAGIVGRVRQDTRSYEPFFTALEKVIKANPALWGYDVVSTALNGTYSEDLLVPLGHPDADNPNPQRVPDYNATTNDAFTLHIIGFVQNKEMLKIPSVLRDDKWPVVRLANFSDVSDYYTAVRDMDVILPAFANKDYLTNRASASIATSVVAQTPLLVSSAHLQAYSYLSLSPHSHILRPVSQDEIDALGTQRRGRDPWADQFGSEFRPRFDQPNEDPHWWDGKKRPKDGEEYLDLLRKENAKVWSGILLRTQPALVGA